MRSKPVTFPSNFPRVSRHPRALTGLAALALLLLGMALGPAPSAQTDAAASQGPPPADPNETATQAEEATPGGEAAPGASPPLEDYQASEQISEDLSVSFPVDI
jgi:hypothetical protein